MQLGDEIRNRLRVDHLDWRAAESRQQASESDVVGCEVPGDTSTRDAFQRSAARLSVSEAVVVGRRSGTRSCASSPAIHALRSSASRFVGKLPP
jgi:hypothetical protein